MADDAESVRHAGTTQAEATRDAVGEHEARFRMLFPVPLHVRDGVVDDRSRGRARRRPGQHLGELVPLSDRACVRPTALGQKFSPTWLFAGTVIVGLRSRGRSDDVPRVELRQEVGVPVRRMDVDQEATVGVLDRVAPSVTSAPLQH